MALGVFPVTHLAFKGHRSLFLRDPHYVTPQLAACLTRSVRAASSGGSLVGEPDITSLCLAASPMWPRGRPAIGPGRWE